MNVRTVKLINGEEIIGSLADGEQGASENVRFQNAVTLQMVKHPETGEPIRGFADWPALAAVDQVIIIPGSALASWPVKVHEDLERHYISAITGMDLPPATPKILLS